MQANLIAAGGVAGPLGTVQMPAKLAKVERQLDIVEITGRPTIEPTPRFEPRQVICPEPRVIDGRTTPVEPEMPSRQVSPIPAVWKTMPEISAEPKPRIVHYEPITADAFVRGRLVDVFV